MKKAPGREAAEADKSRTKTSTERSAGNRIAPKASRARTFDPEALLNSMEGMVFVASADLRLEYMNETALRKLGRDVTGKPCHKALHGLDERCPWCMAGLVLQGQTVRQEVLGRRDGRWYSSIMTPSRREDGSVAIQSLVFDITEQKLAETALRQSEALLKSILQSTPAGIGMVRNRVLAWTNEQISRITGYAPEELKGKSARILYPSDEEFDRVGRHKYAEILRKGTGSIVTVWRRKDGRDVNILLSSTPLDPGDFSTGVVFTALDITEKKKAQDELWRSEEKYRALFENAVMGIFQSTPEGRFLRVNPATAKMCGYDSPDEMVDSITEIASQHYVDPADREPFTRAMEEQGFVRDFEHRTYRKDGSVFWVSVNARAVRDKRGRVTYYEGTHEDIQARKEAEAALRASEERFSKAFHSSPVPVAVSTIDEGRFIEVNDRFVEVFGFNHDEIIGRTSAELGFWNEDTGRRDVMRRLRETGSVRNVPMQFRTRTGELRAGLWSGEIIRMEDRDVLLSILNDITERRDAEEKYQSILAEIDEFYYETDLRGNLTFFNDEACSIIGYSREELQGKNNRDYTTPETAERMYRAFNRVYRTGEKQKIGDYEIICKDGSRRVLEISVALRRDAKGNLAGFRGLGRDVTDRVLAAEALRLSEERYRTLFENSIVGIFQSTPAGRYLRVNPAFARIYGYESPEEVVASITDIGTQIFVDAEDRRRCLAILRETGVLERFEARTRRKDGGVIWTAINSRIVHDAAGQPLFIEGVVEDITQRKRAEEALKASEERFFKVFQSNPIPMTIATLDEGRLVDVNERAIELSGYTREEMVGRTAVEIGLWACPEERDRLIAQIRETGFMRDGLAHFRTRDGKVAPAMWSADRIRLGGDELLLTTIHDISQQVEAQEKLRRSEAMYRLLAENVTDVIWTADVSLSFTYVSPSSERIFGWTPSEWMSKPLRDFLPPDSLEAAKRLLRDEIGGPGTARSEGPRVVTTELEVYRKDGTTCWCEVAARVIRDEDGTPLSLIGVTRDITERKSAEQQKTRLEQQLRQAQKMEAVGTLAGGIAHDFNNILFAVIGYSELCLQDIVDEDHRWNLTQILSACGRAKTLVNQILAFSRQVEQERRPLDVVPLAKEAIKFLRSSLPSTIDVRLDADSGTGTVLADPSQIYQVLMNLCTNAAHAMRASGGRLRVAIDGAEPPADILADREGIPRPEGYVHLRVSDTGHGIEPSCLNRIFDPFFTTKAPGEGTGLGLSVVYGIVKSLGGAIHVDSTPGRGSTFDVYFPAVSAPRANPAGAPEAIRRGTERILFVDDEDHLVDVMGQVLSALGYRVTTVRESRKALQTFIDNPDGFDLVITDMTMPGMTGADLAREILRLRPDMPVILCTGFSELISEEEALKMGIRRFLMKPLFMGDVARELRGLLDGRDRGPAS